MKRPISPSDAGRALQSKRKTHGGGRKPGPAMPCGWCGEPQTAGNIRKHFVTCPKRPPARKEER